jgi:hydroxyacyl-ACP dehydratase HTD2-like protein with hotdog domain
LTLNAHKIHYDLTWAQQQEGHTDLVVHGPMTATLLIELAERAAKEGTNLTRFEYRATSPMYVDREIRLQAAWDVPGEKLNVWAEQQGSVGMKATAIFTPHS